MLLEKIKKIKDRTLLNQVEHVVHKDFNMNLIYSFLNAPISGFPVGSTPGLTREMGGRI